MVLSFPAARVAPLPLCSLLTGAVSFLEGFEDDPDQRDVPQLLRGLRHALASNLIALPAGVGSEVHFSEQIDAAVIGRLPNGKPAFFIARYYRDDGRWHWSANRVDESGRNWHSTGVAVMDDFGDLVEVPE